MKRTYFSILLTALLVAACSSNTSLGEQGGADETPQEAMRFSAPTVGSMDTRASSTTTKALETGFLVSAYKNGGNQVVMDQYEAQYKKDNWNNSSKWETVSGTNTNLYQEQYEKYWDLSAFPYEFIAVAPAPISNKQIIDGFSVKRNSLTVKTPFLISQSAADGTVTPQLTETEYLIAQTERTYTGGTRTDTDKLTGKAIGTSSNATKKVPLPFHHLSTKVRFGIYTTEHISANQHVAIKDVKFTVKSKDASGIVKSIGSYSVDLTQSGVSSALDGTFSGEDREASDKKLLTFSGPTTDKYTDAYLENHEWNSKSDVNAYFFECPDGLLQVPQSGVQISVSLTLATKTGKDVKENEELQITNADGSTTSEFTWLPNRFYTYYIVVKQLLSHDISFTATVSDWENVTGEIETNMEE